MLKKFKNIYKIILPVILILLNKIIFYYQSIKVLRVKRIATCSNDIKHKTPKCINEGITINKEQN